jgi:hypothetical protein
MKTAWITSALLATLWATGAQATPSLTLSVHGSFAHEQPAEEQLTLLPPAHAKLPVSTPHGGVELTPPTPWLQTLTHEERMAALALWAARHGDATPPSSHLPWFSLPAVPEPGALPLMLAGLVGLWVRRRRMGR